MPRFHFHLHDRHGRLHDADGTDLPDLAAARIEAVRYARDMISDDVRLGRIDLRNRLEVNDTAGALLLTLAFDEAIEIVTERPTVGRIGIGMEPATRRQDA